MVSLVPRLRRKGHAEELRRVGLGPREGLPLPETVTARTAGKPWGTYGSFIQITWGTYMKIWIIWQFPDTNGDLR